MFVLFDLDRTLMDMESAENTGIRAVYNRYRNELTMQPEEFISQWKIWAQHYFDEYSAGRYNFDEQRRELVRKMFELNRYPLQSEEALQERFEYYWAAYEDAYGIFGDVRFVLENFKHHKIPMGLLTNGDSKNQRWKLYKARIAEFFDPIVISCEVGVSKPDLRFFKLAVKLAKKKAGTAEKDIWYISDTIEHDVKLSRELKLNTIYLNNRMTGGSRIPHFRIEHYADNVIYAEVRSLTEAGKLILPSVGF